MILGTEEKILPPQSRTRGRFGQRDASFVRKKMGGRPCVCPRKKQKKSGQGDVSLVRKKKKEEKTDK